jgi:hypothetical protein
MTLREAWNLRREREVYHATLPDEVAALIPSDAPVWTPDGHYPEGSRWQYDGKLWKSRQTHDGLNDPTRVPGLAPSLWVQVAPAGAGTIDNPIQYEIGMELELGKYYEENNIKYLCIEALARSDWSLATLAAGQRFVEVVA